MADVTAEPITAAPKRPESATRRVLWVLKGLGRGGAEQLTVTGAQRFDRSRWTVDVAYVLEHKDAYVDELVNAGIAVHCVGRRGSPTAWVRGLRRLVHDGRYDLVHTHSPVPAIAVRTMSSRRRPPVVHTEHNQWSRYHPLTRIANDVTFRRNYAALAVSQGVADSMRVATDHLQVLHHGIDVARARDAERHRAGARAALDLPVDAPVVGSVANLTPKKDHASLVRATSVVRERHRDIRLVLVGAGPLERDLRAQVVNAGLNDQVLFAGSRADVADILPAFDVFALSSTHEGLPIALLEAMASGIAPVATAVGGVPEVLTHGVDGLLVPSGRADELAQALDRLLTDGVLRRGLADAARARAADFDIRRAVRIMEQWYEEIRR